ncbi:MAG: hypothetical protein DWQ37_16620 [Planctomycetota bacterium]|nr:MAG: hypothetical protein DWQ37_16620 [Planctomycetota bacterium]
MRHAAVTYGAALAAMLAAGCGYTPPGKPNPADRPRTPAQITDFDFLFQQNCTGCHGDDGKFGPAPPLNDPIFLAIVPDAELLDVITNGRDGTPMPAFARRLEGPLEEDQIKIIAEGLKKHWKSSKLSEDKLPPYTVAAKDEATSTADTEAGKKVFARACASCHGDNGQGSSEGHKPGRINDPDLLSLMSNQTLRRIIITGRPDLGMPSFAEDDGRPGDYQPLTSEEIDALVALLASWRNQPRSGATVTLNVRK